MVLFFEKADLSITPFYFLYNEKLKTTKIYKSNNVVITKYFDSALDDYIFLASNGMKRMLTFRHLHINHVIWKRKTLNFTCYYSGYEDNLGRIEIFPILYYKQLLSKYLINDKIIIANANTHKRQLLEFKQILLKRHNDKFVSKLLKIKKFNYLISHIDHGWKLMLVDKQGWKFKRFHKYFNTRKIFSGLGYLLTKPIQIIFKQILLLNFLLLKFIKKNWKTRSYKFTLVNVHLYFKYRMFLLKIYKRYLKSRKLKYRQSNRFLCAYKEIEKRINKVIKFFYKYNLKILFTYFISTKEDKWLKNLFIRKYLYTFYSFIKSKRLFSKISKQLSKNKKLKLFKFLLLYIQTNLSLGMKLSRRKEKIFIKFLTARTLLFDFTYNSFFPGSYLTKLKIVNISQVLESMLKIGSLEKQILRNSYSFANRFLEIHSSKYKNWKVFMSVKFREIDFTNHYNAIWKYKRHDQQLKYLQKQYDNFFRAYFKLLIILNKYKLSRFPKMYWRYKIMDKRNLLKYLLDFLKRYRRSKRRFKRSNKFKYRFKFKSKRYKKSRAYRKFLKKCKSEFKENRLIYKISQEEYAKRRRIYIQFVRRLAQIEPTKKYYLNGLVWYF